MKVSQKYILELTSEEAETLVSILKCRIDWEDLNLPQYELATKLPELFK